MKNILVFNPVLRGMFFAGMLMAFAGCLSSLKVDPLELDSVMDLKRTKDADREAEEQELKVWKKEVAASSMDTPVLSILSPPEDFVPASVEELEVLKQEDPRRYPPYAELLWFGPQRHISLMAGKAPFKSGAFDGETYGSFVEKLQGVADVYDQYYQKTYRSSTSTEVDRAENMILFKVESKYLKDSTWMTDVRYFFVFNDEFRLNLFITGQDQALAERGPELREMLADLTHALNRLYPEGVHFSAVDQADA